jgi:hypothetical protein
LLSAGSVILSAGMMIPSDSGIKQVDHSPETIWRLIEKFSALTKDVADKLNKETFNGDWSALQEANPALWEKIVQKMSASDRATKEEGMRLLRALFGIAVEEGVADLLISDAELDDALIHVGGSNQPDFKGMPNSPLSEFTLDITTEAGLEGHLKRIGRPNYGRYLLVITYERWFVWTIDKNVPQK